MVLARYALTDDWVPRCTASVSALSTSPGARVCYDVIRAWNIGNHAALRQLAIRLVGILHGCLKTGTLYDEDTAWAHRHSAIFDSAAA